MPIRLRVRTALQRCSSPSLENRYYYFQAQRVIFKDATGVNDDGEADLTVNGQSVGGVSVSNPVTTDGLYPDTNYYLVIDYYRPGTNGQGEYVQHIVRRSGAELMDSVVLTNTANLTDYIATDSGEHRVLATEVGSVRLGRLNRFTDPKDSNATGTAINAYTPTYTGGTSSEESRRVATPLPSTLATTVGRACLRAACLWASPFRSKKVSPHLRRNSTSRLPSVPPARRKIWLKPSRPSCIAGRFPQVAIPMTVVTRLCGTIRASL